VLENISCIYLLRELLCGSPFNLNLKIIVLSRWLAPFVEFAECWSWHSPSPSSSTILLVCRHTCRFRTFNLLSCRLLADYYSEQKKLEAKELRREAQAKQTEFDVAAKLVAENGLVKTLGMMQF
jgi:hypothetical protein